jgi:hypothetical protein
MEVVKPMHKLRQKILLKNINRIGTCEKSNFSTDALHPSKLGSPSAFVPERRPAASHFTKFVCDAYEKTEELEWPVRRIKKLMQVA